MKRLMIGASVIALLASPVAMAQQRSNHAQQGYPQRDGQMHEQSGKRDNGRHLSWAKNRGHNYHWGRGQRMGYNDWNRSYRVDYRRYNLRQPPRGYEWRRTNDRYLLVSPMTGLIMSMILINRR